jgi:aminocarboxymuconate-semialdehyde decarboxylase
MIGTDYPFNFHDKHPVDRIKEAGFDAQVIEQLTSTNAKRFLGID